jgi:peptidoglycan hydrolase-like protein with peptidoglycan-binding domain
MEERSKAPIAGLIALVVAILLLLPLQQAGANSGGLVIHAETGSAVPASHTGGVRFGSRILREGMVGEDVRVLHALIRAQRIAKKIRLTHRFLARTSGAVRRFQALNSLTPTGIVDKTTARSLTAKMKRARTTWYGPGFYGSTTACGQTLTYNTIGVAHRNLPCGTKVAFHYRGRTLVAEVIDRGPFVRGIMWDLTGAAARSLGFSGSGPIRYAIAR